MPAYVTLPGTSGNYFSTPDVNLLDADTAHIHQSIGDLVRLNPANATLAKTDSALAYIGDSLAKLTVTSASGSGRGLIETTRPGAGGGIAVSGATTYAFSCRTFSPDHDVKVSVLQWNSSNSFLTQTVIDTIPADTALVEVAGSFTTHASAAKVNFQIGIEDGSSPTTDDVVWLDALCFRAGSDSSFVKSLRIVGDLEIEWKAALDDYTPAATNTILDCLNSNDGYRIRHTTGDLIEIAYGNGSSTRAQTSSATGLTDTTAHTFKVTVDQSTGAVVYYIDGVQHDTDTMTTGAGSPDINDLVVGANAAASANWTDGDIYYVIVRDGIDGIVTARFDADDWVGV